MMRTFFLLLLPFLIIASAQAAEKTPPEARCPMTPKLAVQNYPGAANIPPGNNLLKPAGKALTSGGQRVVILGRLFDSRCIPINNATVEMWQADPYGKWILATREDRANPNPVFAGAGRTYSDNTGQFFFVTSFPGPVKGRAPHLNLKIKAQGIPEFTTALYFGSDARNDSDDLLKRVPANERERITLSMQEDDNGGYMGYVTLTIPGKASFRSY